VATAVVLPLLPEKTRYPKLGAYLKYVTLAYACYVLFAHCFPLHNVTSPVSYLGISLILSPL
jgi:hypothetical protein